MSKALLSIFDDLYQQKVGARYPVNGGKDGKLLKDLRAIYSDEEIEGFMRAFFEMEDDFFATAGWSLGCFRSCLPKVIAWVNRKGSVAINWKHAPRGVDRFRPDPTWDADRDCPHDGGCGSRGICQMLQSAERRRA